LTGGLINIKDFFGEVWIEEIKRKGYVISQYGYKITKKYIEDSLKYDLEKEISKIKIPTLFIYGEEDYIVPPFEGLKFYKKIKAPKKIVILKNLDHYFSNEITQKEIIKITFNWIKKWLK
jgi:dipeptidyl aminopeptidase/acylaminoacyl peptidase